MGSIITKLVPLAFFALIAFVVYLSSKYNYLLKKAILEKGGDVAFPKKKSPFLELGLTAIGIGVGLSVAAVLSSLQLVEQVRGLLIGASVLSFSGLGMLLAFFIRKRIEQKGDA